MTFFQYHADILAQFPDVVGGVILAQGMSAASSNESLSKAYIAEQQATLARIGDTPLSEIESLAAWRKAFRSFGVNPTKYRSAAEALLRRLTKKGDIPEINTLVDLCNMVSIRYALPVAVFDTHAVQSGVTVCFADGSEKYMPLGQQTAEHPEPGEVVFTDENKMVIARRWCWRQSGESASRADTQNAIITVEAHHAGGRTDIESAMNDLQELLNAYAGGSTTADILDKNRPRIAS